MAIVSTSFFYAINQAIMIISSANGVAAIQ